MIYIAIDVQLIVGGRTYELHPEEYILAVLLLFLDIIYLFWMFLQILGGSDRR